MISADELLEEINLLYTGGRYKEMIELLNDAISQNSTFPELYYFRGIAWISIKSNEAAIDDLTRAIDLRPDYFRAYHHRGITWNVKGQYDKAVRDLLRATELRPNHAATHRHLGDAWMNKKDYDQAIETFTRGIELLPDAYDLYHNRGSAWRKKGEYQKAIADYHKALELKPGHGRSYFALGATYEAIGEPELASIHFKRAYYLRFDKTEMAKIFRSNFPAPYIVKSILFSDEDTKGLEANFSTVEWLIATCKPWDDLLEHLRSKQYHVTHPGKFYSLEAMVNYYMGNSIAAYRIFDTQFDSDEHPDPLTLKDQYYLALAAIDFKEPDNGLAYAIEQAKEQDGSDPAGSYYAGRLFLLDNDLDSALRSFEQAGDYLPALYGKIAVHRWLEHTGELLQTAEKIAEVEAAVSIRGAAQDSIQAPGLLDGITPLVIRGDMSFEEIFDRIMQLVHYYELTEEIEEVRTLLNRQPRYPDLGFNKLLDIPGPL